MANSGMCKMMAALATCGLTPISALRPFEVQEHIHCIVKINNESIIRSVNHELLEERFTGLQIEICVSTLKDSMLSTNLIDNSLIRAMFKSL